MRGFWAIFKRELFAFFVTPLAWVLIVVFLLVQGMHFALLVDHFATTVDVASDQTPLQAFFGNTVLLYVVLFLLVPPITMRLFAEERRSGTVETLLTTPVSPTAVVLAKYGAAVVTYGAMWLPTVLYVMILRRAGEVDLGATAAAYLGVVALGAAYLAVGLLASAATESQFLALVLSALVILAFFILGVGEFITHEGSAFHALCTYVSVWGQMNDFGSGLVDTRRLTFDATLVLLPLFLTVRLVDSWRWAGGRSGGRPWTLGLRALQISSLAGVAAAVVLAVVGNVVAARHPTRWDATATRRYSLSPATKGTLHDLSAPVVVWVLLGDNEPLLGSLRPLLAAYQAETAKLEVRYVDPDRDALQLEEVRRRFHVETGRSEGGHVVADAVVIVDGGQRPWFLTPQDLVEVNAAEGRARPREEQALTHGLRQVIQGERTRLCFTAGHGEVATTDHGPRGAGDLRDILEKDNYEVAEVSSSAPDVPEPFRGCRVVVVAGPRGAFGAQESAALHRYLEEGGNLFAAVGPIPAADGTGFLSLGLDDVLSPFGMALGGDVVVEREPSLTLPDGNGSEFFARPSPHPITAGLVASGDGPKVGLSVVRSLSVVGAGVRAPAMPLLSTSERAVALTTVAAALGGGEDATGASKGGPFTVALAGEGPRSAPAERASRAVVVGTSRILEGPTFRQPLPLRGAALFVEGALSWLASRPQILDIPPRDTVAAGLRLTVESRDDVRRYVLFYMPLAAALLGVAIALRRRTTEGR